MFHETWVGVRRLLGLAESVSDFSFESRKLCEDFIQSAEHQTLVMLVRTLGQLQDSKSAADSMLNNMKSVWDHLCSIFQGL